MNKPGEEGALEGAREFSRGIVTLEVTQSKFNKVNDVDRGHGAESKNESKSVANPNRLKSEVYTERARPKAGRTSVSFRTGMVADIVRVDKGSMSSAKHS